MRKAIFLDRDGVILNEWGDYNYLPHHIEINDGIVEVLTELSARGYLFFVITNQAGIAKGIYHHHHVNNIHKIIKEFFSSFHIQIEEFYYCPHHSSTGMCICRKPDSLLLEKCIAKYQIDPKESYFIGDNERDEIAGKKVSLNTILIESNENLLKYLPQIK